MFAPDAVYWLSLESLQIRTILFSLSVDNHDTSTFIPCVLGNVSKCTSQRPNPNNHVLHPLQFHVVFPVFSLSFIFTDQWYSYIYNLLNFLFQLLDVIFLLGKGGWYGSQTVLVFLFSLWFLQIAYVSHGQSQTICTVPSILLFLPSHACFQTPFEPVCCIYYSCVSSICCLTSWRTREN